MSNTRIIDPRLVEFAAQVKEMQKTNSVMGIVMTGPNRRRNQQLLAALLEAEETSYEIVEPKMIENENNNQG